MGWIPQSGLAAAALSLGLCSFAASAAPAGSVIAGPAAPPVQYDPYFRHYDSRYQPCPYRYHWDCWYSPYGRGACGCRPEPGLYTGW